MNRYKYSSDFKRPTLQWPDLHRVYSGFSKDKKEFGVVKISKIDEENRYVYCYWLWVTKGFSIGLSSGFSNGSTMGSSWEDFQKTFSPSKKFFEVKLNQKYLSKLEKIPEPVRIIEKDTFYRDAWRTFDGNGITRTLNESQIYRLYKPI